MGFTHTWKFKDSGQEGLMELAKAAKQGDPLAIKVLEKGFRLKIATTPQIKRINKLLSAGELSQNQPWL